MRHRALRAVTGLYPLQTPRARLLRLLPVVPAGYGPFTARDRIRYAAYPPGGDHVVKSLFWFGDFDRWVGDTLALLARPGDVACDVGANIGDTALALARAVGPEGSVWAFEPLPAIRDCLAENARANGLDNLHVVGVALSDAQGELAIDVPEGQPGMASLRVDGTAGGIRVPTVRFDDWLDRSGVAHVDVCKIDVEGHEEAVLRGMAQSFDRRLVSSVVFERHGNAGPGDPVIEMFRALDFEVMQIRKRMLRAAYVGVGQDGPGAPTADFVAVLRGSAAEGRLTAPDREADTEALDAGGVGP
jgi:FkbM family methyltransferase